MTFDVVPRLLEACENVDEALSWLDEHRVVMPESPFGIHWAITDASGRSIVVEYIAGERRVHDGVRVMTNDPPLDFHLRNLNTYVNLNPDFPHQNDFLGVETEVGMVPRTVGHGWNLAGLPGDSSPVSRFVQLFYLRGYATKFAPPKSVDDGIVLATGLLNKVFLPNGVVAKNEQFYDNYDYVPWAMVKIPSERRVLIRGYRNTRWRQIDLRELDFDERLEWPIEDGTLGIEDITRHGAVTQERLL